MAVGGGAAAAAVVDAAVVAAFVVADTRPPRMVYLFYMAGGVYCTQLSELVVGVLVYYWAGYRQPADCIVVGLLVAQLLIGVDFGFVDNVQPLVWASIVVYAHIVHFEYS